VSLVDVERLRAIAEVEFADIVVEAFSPGLNELRVILTDGSFVDVWFSLKLQGRYSFHWERQAIDGTIYRHDNAPHRRWEAVATFPRHFHKPTVSLGVTSAVVDTYGRDDGKIAPTRCAIIDAGFDGR
jgi:uncharacterized protein DUF6516